MFKLASCSKLFFAPLMLVAPFTGVGYFCFVVVVVESKVVLTSDQSLNEV